MSSEPYVKAAPAQCDQMWQQQDLQIFVDIRTFYDRSLVLIWFKIVIDPSWNFDLSKVILRETIWKQKWFFKWVYDICMSF